MAAATRNFIRIHKVHILLFVLTVATTLTAGAFQSGANPFEDIRNLSKGIPFSFTLIIILLFHELSHYFTARAHRTNVTLPYFIPAPTFLGTFGAVIKIRSPLSNRNALFDLGVSGPTASFLLSTIAVIIGLSFSTVTEAIPGRGIYLGDSILFGFLTRVVKGNIPGGHDVLLSPIAFAGWIGLLITAINLIPAGQLDGGHISYSVFGNRHVAIARFTVVLMIVAGFFWFGWFIWAILIAFLGVRHPPPLDEETPLSKRRKIGAILAGLMLILTFVPVPFGGF